MRRPSQPVLDGVSVANRLRIFAALCLALSAAFGATRLMAVDNAWIHQNDIDNLVDSDDAENYPTPLASCGIKSDVPGGLAPAWIRVGGSTNPHTPIIEVTGQVLDPHAYVSFASDDDIESASKTNAFVNYTDAPFNHYARDLNMFLTLDPEHRHRLSTGSFGEGDSNERGNFEIEWERGGIPMYAFPAIGDRMKVWGTHVFDCGHGDSWVIGRDDEDNYRTEIHAPFGWVVYRQTADADGVPDGGKETVSPWAWYGPTDLKGMAVALPTSGLLSTLVQATVADAYFSSFSGNVVESINGCDEDNVFIPCYDDDDRPELNGSPDDIHSWEWHSPILDQDYSFVVPAPPVPVGAPADTQMIFEVEDRCSEVPKNPTIPNRDDHKEALEEVEGTLTTPYSKDWPIGSARCNHAPTGEVPYVIDVDRGTGEDFEPWNDTERPAIRVTVRARTGHDGIYGTADDPQYPANDYISFAYRVKVAWDYAPPALDRARAFRADFDTLEVYNDGEECLLDGEWIMTLRVNDQTIHPVQGTADDDVDSDDIKEPFWEDNVIDGNQCGEGINPDYGTPMIYEMGSNDEPYLTRFFTALPDVPIEVWDRTYEKDELSSDDLAPVFRETYAQPYLPGDFATHTIGTVNPKIDVAHRIWFRITNVSSPIPANGPLAVGAPQFGPAIATSFLLRVKGTTPITLTAPAGVTAFEWRAWKQTVPASEPGPWQYDYDDSDGLTVDLPDTGDGTYTVEWAAILDGIVSERSRMDLELDNIPPTLTLPADFSVYANSAAGADVTYEASATDNLPGPIVVNCSPASGTVFPNGANAPLTTTVNCTATDAVTNQSSDTFDVTVMSPHGYIGDYAAMGIEWLDSAQDGSVITGGLGVFDLSGGMPGQPDLELRLGNDGSVIPPASIAAHSVRLGADVMAGDVFSVTPLVAGANSVFTERPACGGGPASLDKCAYVPLWPSLPAFVGAGPAGINRTISGTVAVNPGNYGALVIKSKGVAVLAAGSYSFTRIEVGPNGKIIYPVGSTVVRVAGRVEVRSGGSIQPVLGGAPHLLLYVGGTDAPPNKPAVDIAAMSVVGANVYAPNGTLAIGNQTIVSGAYIGRRVKLGSNVTLTKDSVFVQ